jgi:hypothetical protein
MTLRVSDRMRIPSRIPMRNVPKIHYRAELPPSTRGRVLLLHVDQADAPPCHAVLLVLPDEPHFSLGRPLREWPELCVARIWPDETAGFVTTLAADTRAITRWCPLCTR